MCIEKILRYITLIGKTFTTHNTTNEDEFEADEICQLAITQLVTNTYEALRKISEETLAKLPLFSKMRLDLKFARNIASHDYESVDFERIYSIAKRLQIEDLVKELEDIKNDLS